MVNNNRWKRSSPYPHIQRKKIGRKPTNDKAADYETYLTSLHVDISHHQSFYDRIKNYIGDTEPRFRKLMRGEIEPLKTLSRGFLEKCGREIWATEPSPWKHDRLYGKNWVAENWLKDQVAYVLLHICK